MTEISNVTEDEAVQRMLEGNAVILGGVEVHVRSVSYKGDPGIQVDYMPPFGPDDCPDWMEDINNRLAGLCRSTVMNMNDHARRRLLSLVQKDAGKDRMIYRLYVTSRIEDDGSHTTQVHDFVDPSVERIDRGIAGRAAGARREVESVLRLKGDKNL
ncbi:MAG: hypothetical protein WC379_18440 [Methanoregula sp.]